MSRTALHRSERHHTRRNLDCVAALVRSGHPVPAIEEEGADWSWRHPSFRRVACRAVSVEDSIPSIAAE